VEIDAAGVQTPPARASRGVGAIGARQDERNLMPKFLCVQRSLPDAGGAKPSPAEMQAMYAKFNAWREKFEKNIVDLGGKLGDGKLVTAESAGDGPFVEVKELVGGYMILTAETLDEAAEIAAGVPGLVSPGSGVEVIEIRTP